VSFLPGRHGHSSYGDHLELRAQVCIVGAGAGGCAAAAVLAERGISVVVLEEGSHWSPSQFKSDTSWAMRNLYQGRGFRSLRGNTVMPLPGGRGVGGSTLINSAICFRCPDEVLESWRDSGCEAVDLEQFKARFDRIWDTLGVTVQSLEIQRLNNIVFKEGADKLGLDAKYLARSAPGCAGCGVCQYGCPSGGKSSADRTFLVEALASGRVGVYADCRVLDAEVIGDRVVAVSGQTMNPDTLQPAGTVRVTADTFVLSAGPVGSPLFLAGNRLASSENCGQHLVVHPTVGALARFPFEILPWHGVTQGCYVDCWSEGYLLQTYTVTPDQYFVLMPERVGADTMAAMADLAHYGSAGALVHDEDSSGQVRWTPVGPDLSYQLGEGDRLKLLRGLRKVGEVFLAAGATHFLPPVIGGGRVRSVRDVHDLVPLDTPAHHLLLYASHPMGTCRMGAEADSSVVDPWGRVWGWSNLRVADASIFPSSLGVNPQVTTMAMAMMVAESVAETG